MTGSEKSVHIGEISEKAKKVACEVVDLFAKHELNIVEVITVIDMLKKSFEEEYGVLRSKVW